MNELINRDDTKTEVAATETTRPGHTYVPRFDICEYDDELLLRGDMPGVTPGDLDVRFENEHLVVHGKVQPRHEDRQCLYREYGIGDYYREFHVMEDVDPSKISAELRDGVLSVHLPKAEKVKPRRIEVKSA
jgi:HSP20 family protein